MLRIGVARAGGWTLHLVLGVSDFQLIVSCLIVLAIASRVALLLALSPATPVGDMDQYIRLATEPAARAGLESTDRGPVYPALLGLAARAHTDPVRAACLLNIVLGAVSVVLVAVVARRLLSRRWALVAASMIALEPALAVYSTMVLTEVTAVTLVTAAVVAITGIRDWRAAALAGACLGAAALTRDSLVLFVPLAALVVGRHAGARPAAALAMAAVLTILPWSMRTTLVAGRPVLISTSCGYNLLIGNNRFADGSQRGGRRILADEASPVSEGLDPGTRHARGTRHAVAWIVHHPGHFLLKGMAGAVRMFGLDRQLLYAWREGYYAARVPRLLVLALAAVTMGSWIVLLPLALLGVLVARGLLRDLGIAALVWMVMIG
ncbi:MAG: glycosyltransferase family 39 protein, partial [Candidatus Eiseniibacteriota bacterium]